MSSPITGIRGQMRMLTKTGVALTGGDVEDIFTVKDGPILVHQILVEITAAVSNNACALHFEVDPDSGSATDIAEGTGGADIDSAAIGTIVHLNGDSQDVMKIAVTGTDLPMMENQNGSIWVPSGGIDLKLANSNPTTGTANVHIVYTPLNGEVTT